jgi:DNA-binding Lrp family transcriptional regulator
MTDLQELDGFDLKLLVALQKDGRLTNAELGEKIGLSASQCSRRRIRLEDGKIIEGYHARLNAERLGVGLMALIQVTLGSHSADNSRKFESFVGGVDEIQEAYALTGDSDYMLKVVARSLADLSKLISDTLLAHPAVAHVKSSIVLKKLKDMDRLPLLGGL